MEPARADVQSALCQAAGGGDWAAFAAALDAYRALAAQSGRRADGMARDFGVLRQAAPAIARALATLPDGGLGWAERLAADPMSDLRCLACLLVGAIGQHRPRDVMPLARRLGADGDWVVREFIANALDDGMGPIQGDLLFAQMEQWADDPDPNVRRVPTNALMRYGRRHPDRVAGLMARLRRDPSEYVRKNVAFCLGVLGLDYHHMLGVRDPGRPRWLLGILRDWAADPDPGARWIAAETLGRKWTRACLPEAAGLLRAMADDPDRAVRRQVQASIKANAGYGTHGAGAGPAPAP